MRIKGTAKKLKILIALIFIFQGVSIAFTSHPILKINPWLRLLGLGMMAVGIGYVYIQYRSILASRAREAEAEEVKEEKIAPHRVEIPARRAKKIKPAETEEMEVEIPRSIVGRIMFKLTNSARSLSYLTLPIFGALIIDAVFIYNFMTGQGLAFQTWDTVTIMLGGSLIAYNFIPEQYSTTRDFIVFFLALLFMILVLPQIFYSIFIGEEASANYTKILLADPVVVMLNLFGIDAWTSIEFVEGSTYTAIIHYTMANGEMQEVGITESCSGIYTTSIFISAFITYVLVEYQHFNKKVVLILILGVITSYFANILRMTIITGVGYYYGTDALLKAHANAGWLIFLAWIIPFWFLVFKYLIKEEAEVTHKPAPAE
ncbi:MAG: archaeosortase/exosortase family protein [Thermoplasmata archaeon]|nr:MAG: archaeosortase/exosortase family protein [Thermoplasmata archaeon]